MSNRHYPPAYLRYLKARLWNLSKPSFWGTAIFLSVVGLVVREYWSNPNLFTHKQNKEVTSLQVKDSSLSAEDKAIAADIDNLPSLYNDSEQITLPATVSNSKENQANKSKGLLDAISKQQSSNDLKSNSSSGVNNLPASNEQNPFVVQTENLLRFGALDSGSQFSGMKSLNASSEPTGIAQTSSRLGGGLVNQTDKSQNKNSITSLQTPLNQSTNQTSPSFNGASSTSSNSLGQTSYYGGGLQSLPSNSLPSQISPTTGLNTGTGYIQQTVPNQLSNPYNNSNTTVPNQLSNPYNNSITPIPNQPPNPYNNLNTTVSNQLPNPYSNLNRSRVLPSQVQQTLFSPPVTSAAPTIAPYSSQIPSSNVVTPTTPVVTNNPGNSIWQQPTQVPQSTSVPSQQIPGQYIGGVQSNGYSYP